MLARCVCAFLSGYRTCSIEHRAFYDADGSSGWRRRIQVGMDAWTPYSSDIRTRRPAAGLCTLGIPTELEPAAVVIADLRDPVRAVELECAAERASTGATRRVRAVVVGPVECGAAAEPPGPRRNAVQVGADSGTAAQPRICRGIRERPRALAKRHCRRVAGRHLLVRAVRVGARARDLSSLSRSDR